MSAECLPVIWCQSRRKLIINPRNNCISSEAAKHCSGSQGTFLVSWKWRFVTLSMRGHIEFYAEWHKFSLQGLNTFRLWDVFNIKLLLMPRSPLFFKLSNNFSYLLKVSPIRIRSGLFCLYWRNESYICWTANCYKLLGYLLHIFLPVVKWRLLMARQP